MSPKIGFGIAVLAATLIVPVHAFADNVYRCTDRDGRVSYQGKACGSISVGNGMLYKCSGPKGAVAIQSSPCPDGAKTVWARAAKPEVETEESRRRQQEKLRRQHADARALSRTAGTDGASASSNLVYSAPNAHDEQVNRCNAAKRHRDDVLNQIGLRRTYELLQALDKQVAEACRGL